MQLANPIGAGFSLRDLAASTGYFNQARRWQWGVVGHVIPTYVGVRTGATRLDALDMLAPFAVVRQIERAIRGGTSYPFSRARRIELSGGASRLAFDELGGFFGAVAWTPAAEAMTLGSASRRIRERHQPLRCNEPGQRGTVSAGGRAGIRNSPVLPCHC